ncbi:hypothetical protein Tco_0300890 [Tanacetum coccineum]
MLSLYIRCSTDESITESKWKEKRVRLLVSSPGASLTPSYSPRPSTPPSCSSGPSTPQSYSPGPSRNAECSNYKHLLGKIMILWRCETGFMELNRLKRGVCVSHLEDCRQPLGCDGNVHKTSHELAKEKDCLVLIAEVAGSLMEDFRGKLEVEVEMVEEKAP